MVFYADITDPDRVVQKPDTLALDVSDIEKMILNDISASQEHLGPQNTKIIHWIAKWGDSFPIIRDGLVRALAREAYGYFENSAAQTELDARCKETIGDRTFKIMIGHSFGSVIGYKLLARQPGIAEHFITLGSPLGTPFMRQRLSMNAAPVFEKLQSWHDYADDDDIVSYRELKISKLFKNYTGEPPRFHSNRTIVNPTFNEHSIQGYIAQPVVIDHILAIHRGKDL